MSEYVVCALYKFVELADFEALRTPLYQTMLDNEVRGTLLLAREGINGTISGSQRGIDAILHWLKSHKAFADLDYKCSLHKKPPFHRTKVKLKKEIVTMGIEGIDPRHTVGTYVEPKDWNALISSEDVILIDTRNDYEVGIGTFKGAVNPDTQTFREFPDYVNQQLDSQKHKRVAMFCTGGIRCEKSTAFLKEQGFAEVYHLKGGILKYLEEVPKEESLWEGECFVFDERVAVGHDLKKGQYDQCFACRYPITEADKKHAHYQQGVSCPRCYEQLSEQQKQRFEEREKQSQLARERGESHIGLGVKDTIERRRAMKKAQKEAQAEASKGQ